MQYAAVVLVSVVAVWHSAAAECQSQSDTGPPHVVFFLVDDLGFNDISWNNAAEIKTPNLQHYAETGIILDYNYVQPVCSPSRGALHSGKFGHRIGMQHNVLFPDTPECLPLSNVLLPEELKKVGYSTHLLGKWHLGFCDERCTPLKRGYDTFYGFYNAMGDHYTHRFMYNYDFFDNWEVDESAAGTYTEDLLVARAESIIANHEPSTPLFLMFSDPLVHTPLQLPDNLPSSDDRDTYLGMVERMDEAFGKVVQALKDAGLYDNSVIIFTSDNGGPSKLKSGVDPWASNAPLRGAKSSSYEGGTRSPGLFHSPRQTITGVRTKEMIHIVDWFATILDLAGTSPSTDIDGVSQVAMLMNGGRSARDEFAYNIDQYHPYPYGNAIRMGDFKLIRGYPGTYDGYHGEGTIGYTSELDPYDIDDEPIDFDVPDDWTQDEIYAKKCEGRVMLFNVIEDPEERRDLSAQMPRKVAEMSARMDQYLAEAKSLDLAHQEADPAAWGFGGVWLPGWCDASIFG